MIGWISTAILERANEVWGRLPSAQCSTVNVCIVFVDI